MRDDELRALVRDAIARHLGPQGGPHAPRAGSGVDDPGAPTVSHPLPLPLWRAHPSFGKFLVPSGIEQDGPCLIEPAVHCNHCGFCQSYGH